MKLHNNAFFTFVDWCYNTINFKEIEEEVKPVRSKEIMIREIEEEPEEWNITETKIG